MSARRELLRLLFAAAFPEVDECATAAASGSAAPESLSAALRERDEAREQARLACLDVASIRVGAEALKTACEASERAAKAARDSRDSSEAKLRDVTRDLENEKRLRSEEGKALAVLRKTYGDLFAEHEGCARGLAKARQAIESANEEMNRLRLAGRNVETPT